MNKANKLRHMFKGEGVIRIAGAHNGLSAKLVERAGFDGVWASGLEVSTSYCVPDANILTMSHFLEAASTMNDAVRIPVIADCDTGYGNFNNVMYMAKKFESAGIAAVCIEDKLFPKVNSFIPGRQELAPIPEFVGKVMAAKSAQISEDFMVFARVEALIAGWGQEEALKRARAYVEAGADGIFIHSKSESSQEILDFVNNWESRIPLIICPTTYSSLNLEDIKGLGSVRMVIYANHGIRASIRAMSNVLKDIHSAGTTKPIEGRIAPMKEVFELQGMVRMKELERAYLRAEKEPVKVIIPAAGDDSGDPSLSNLVGEGHLSMIDVCGKPLLQRSIETLNNLNIYDIDVVTGYQNQSINLEGINAIHNPDYNKTFIMDSIMKSARNVKGRTMVVFSDILFERDVAERLLKSQDDITLVIDRSFKTSGLREGKRLDLVSARHSPPEGERVLRLRKDNPILKIGKNVPSDEANYEFIGMALFSKKGIEILKREYERAGREFAGKPFHEAESFEKASFTDMIQELINRGHNVSSVEIDKGWTEIRNTDDYKRVCSMLSEQNM